MGLFGSKKKVEDASAGGEAVLGDGSRVQVARRVDCRGDSCPRPQLMTKKAVNEVAAGGVVEVLAYGVPVGLGSHVHWDRKIDAALAQAVMSIQAVKGVEIGEAFDVAGRRGSVAHDAISWVPQINDYRRDSSLAGGTEGGMTTGELLVVRAAMKPLATLNRPTLKTVDVVTKEQTVSFKERTDVTAVPACAVVAETMVALVLATEAQRKFGGDSVSEFVRNATSFKATLP